MSNLKPPTTEMLHIIDSLTLESHLMLDRCENVIIDSTRKGSDIYTDIREN